MPIACRTDLIPKLPLRMLSFGCIILLCTSTVLARAGGGEGYSSGGGSSGGGGGGDIVDLIWLIFQLVRLCIYHPFIGIPILICIIAFFIYAARQGNDMRVNRVLRKGSAALSENRKTDIIAQLQNVDPSFSEVAFFERVKIAFIQTQSAWCAQNLQPVRPFISDSIYERFNLQFNEQKDAGYQDFMDQIEIQQLTIAGMSITGQFHALSVRIEASSINYRVSPKTGKRISGSTSSEPFVEIWTFLRRITARTKIGQTGLLEGNCPNCGASVGINQSAVCEHCKALLRSGEFDWVLVEITQESEWREPADKQIAGLDIIQSRDPDFDLSTLEDRTSVIFWRKATAERTGKIEPLRKMATKEYCDQLTKQLDIPANQSRQLITNCAVGSVDTLGLIPGDENDQALIEIRWAGTRMTRIGDEISSGSYGMYQSLYILTRNSKVKTDIKAGVSSAHCPKCGAPVTSSLSSACEFCGTVLNDGLHGWVLSDALSMLDPKAQAMIARLLPPSTNDLGTPLAQSIQPSSPPPSAGLLAWMIKMAAIDGNIDDSEKAMLTKVAVRRNVSPNQLQNMFNAALQFKLEVPEPTSRDEARLWLQAIAGVALANGRLDKLEANLLDSVGSRIGFSQADIDLIINRAKVDQIKSARDEIRKAKGIPLS